MFFPFLLLYFKKRENKEEDAPISPPFSFRPQQGKSVDLRRRGGIIPIRICIHSYAAF
jgi:hypothetical protein